MTAKDPIREPYTLNIRGKLRTLTRPWVMGIINITPDSFYAGSREMRAEEAAKRALAMAADGADILDIGACSTRPGSEGVSAREEIARLRGPLERIRTELPDAIISIDTYQSEVARFCLEEFAVDIINDVSGGADPAMYEVVAAGKAVYILMHTRGSAMEMDGMCDYGADVTAKVIEELAFKLYDARQKGIADVIVDPGFGFAKKAEQNYRMLAELDRFAVLGCPVLVGMSRKRMAREAAGCTVADSLTPTIALNAVALMKGAHIIRVHDVAEGVATAKTIDKLWSISE